MENNFLTEIIHQSSQKKLLTFARNDHLFREGEEANGIYVIISGRVKITKHNKPNTNIILRIANVGEALAIHAVVNHHSYTSSAIALAKTLAYLIPADEFLRIIRDNTGYRLKVMKMLCSNISTIENNNIRNEKTAGERLADTLMSLVRTYGTDKAGYIDLELPLQDFTELVGTSRDYLNRLMYEFNKSGLISTENGKIKVLDFHRLGIIAGTNESPINQLDNLHLPSKN